MHLSFFWPQYMHVVVFIAFACMLLPGSAHAQSGFYRYVDEAGRVRYTDNPVNVPSDQYQGMPIEAPFSRSKNNTGQSGFNDSQRIVVNYDAEGGTIFVNAVLDRHYPVLFQVDTGATRTMITENDARMLNLSLESTKTVRGMIADGSIVEMPVVNLASIGLGEALVEDLEVTVGKLRLLGMDFLGNFELNINSQVGQLVLVEKDSAQVTADPNRESESDAIRQDRAEAKRDIDSQVSQLTLAIKNCHSTIEQYQDDIDDAEIERVNAESALEKSRKQNRFQGSGVSREDWKESSISRIEKNIQDIDAYVQNRNNHIKLQQEQIASMQSRINYLRVLKGRIN